MIKRQIVSNQRSFFKNARAATIGSLAFFIALFLMPALAWAAGDIPTLSGVVEGTGLPMVNLTVFLLAILRIFFGLLGVLAIALLMYGGFIWMTAAGEPDKVTKAKQIIYNTIIGLIVIFSAFAITSFLMAWLNGLGGGGDGGGTTRIPGGNGDWGRSAIGAGPIQSVYPAPNAVNVPINTRIAVTFKVNIDPSSICELVAGETYCNGGLMKNVTICAISSTSSDCLPDPEFNANVYADTKVYQATSSDQRTFIFSTNNYLGLDDNQVRIFKVHLGADIEAAATNESVFANLRYPDYAWAFKTNGVLDFSPPEVARMEIYPNPDNTPDTYNVGAQSTVGSASITASITPRLETPPTIQGRPFTGTPLVDISLTEDLDNDPIIPDDYLKLGTSGFSVTSTNSVKKISFQISPAGEYIEFDISPDAASILGVTFSRTGVCANKERCLLVDDNKRVTLTGSGLTIASTGNFSEARGSKWSFTVSPAVNGDEVILANGTNKINFIFADTSLPAKITKRSVASDGRTIVNTDYFTVKSAATSTAGYLKGLNDALIAHAGNFVTSTVATNKIIVTPKAAGANSLSLTTNSSALAIDGNLSGEARVTARTPLPPGSKGDAYNNSVFRVSFTEAISPINIEQHVIIKINGDIVTASTTLTNQYRTLEFLGTKPCGVNSCGKQMYCWLDPNSADVSLPASIEIVAAGLKTCVGTNDDWCVKFGGTCQVGVDGGRCQLTNGLHYPQADVSADGVTDMANNSFNGNFNKSENNKGVMVGNAEGRSGTGAGRSGQPAYNANSITTPIHFDGLVTSFANDGDANGDNFSWSFFVSTQIDRAAPLIAKILPTGDSSHGIGLDQTFRDPVTLVFNGLMRLATLQPGWGYGEREADPRWHTRYLILKTITAGANPIGYWVSALNLDEGDFSTEAGRGDGLADYTEARINHSAYDQAVNYGPLAGNGIESITQNCLLPGNGPIDAGATGDNKCVYNSDGSGNTSGCVTDLDIDSNRRVTSTNPSSYGYLLCKDIDGAVLCASDKKCKAHVATSTNSVLNGSWIITKDKSITDFTTGETGCCFGKCF
ncbi:MAG: hypothetical protein WC517_00190 [Patescibacteria group bacterium]